MKCQMCNSQTSIHEHHIHPKFMDNISGYGEKMLLCKKHHNILHLIIPSIIWKHLPKENKRRCITEVTRFTYNYTSERETINKNLQILKSCLEKGFLIEESALNNLKKSHTWKEDLSKVQQLIKWGIITKKHLKFLKKKNDTPTT